VNEDRIKALTGSDPVTARFLYLSGGRGSGAPFAHNVSEINGIWG